MFDIGMVELLVIGIVALIVIGPKDLPALFHNIGRFTARARAMARDFSRAMEDAARESGVDDVAKDLRNITNPRKLGMDALSDAAKSFEDWEPMKSKPADRGLTKRNEDGEKPALSPERAEAAKKIQEATARKASERLAAEARAAEDAADAAARDIAKTQADKETAAKPAAAKKPAAKKSTAKKPAAKKAIAKKSPAKKPAAKAAGKSGTTTKATARKTATANRASK